MNGSGYTLWFTGMTGAGKRTLARHIHQRYARLGRRCEFLSDDDLQPFLPTAPDATLEVRNRNARILGWVAELLTRQGVVVLVASLSPIREVRDEICRRIGRCAEIFVDCAFEVLQQRDSEKIYQRALEGVLDNVIGVQLPYEPPLHPDVRVDSGEAEVEKLAEQVFEGLFERGFLSRTERDLLLGRIEPATTPPVVEVSGEGEEGIAPKAAAAAKCSRWRQACPFYKNHGSF